MPLDGDVAKITRRAEEFRDLPESLQRNLQTFLALTMDALATVHQKVKSSMAADSTKQMVRCARYVPLRGARRLTARFQNLANLRRKSRSIMIFAGILKYRMSPDVYSYLARLDVEIAL